MQDALKEVNGVANVKVDLEGANAVVDLSGDVGDEQLREAVADAGYDLTKIENL